VEATTVWDRPESSRRVTLTREAIVATAIDIADRESLGAVTVRRLAVELGARPMSIYLYARIESKEELYDLLIDQVCGEMLLENLPRDWRQALVTAATAYRTVLLRHPWWIELIGRDVSIGPNGIRYREQMRGAVTSLSASDRTKESVVVSVETYMVGHVAFALDERSAAVDADGLFATGLRWLISGIASDLEKPRA
jgi:AcrR family transcriptional regulator